MCGFIIRSIRETNEDDGSETIFEILLQLGYNILNQVKYMDSDISYNYSILLGNAYRTLRTYVSSCLEKYQLIPTHWSLIGTVYQRESGITLSDAAVVLGVKLPLVSLMVDYLESKKLIERVANEADGRSKLLIGTKEGARQVAIIEADLTQTLAPLLAGVPADQLRAFKAVLQAIIDNEPGSYSIKA